MLPKFLESLGENIAKEWLSKVLLAALVFWLGGLLAVCSNPKFGWKIVEPFLGEGKNLATFPLNQLIVGLLAIAVSAAIVQRLELNVLRWLEGYWHRWLNPIRRGLVRRQESSFNHAKQTRKELFDRYDSLTSEEMDELVRLDWQRKQTPKQSDRLMPTRLGNILRAAERRPLEKYGLETVICFPRLWLLLPAEVKTELSEARSRLNSMVRIWIWSVLFLGWSYYALWVIPVGLVAAWFAHDWMLDAAAVYGDLLESAFDLYRTLLYKSLRLPLPKNPTEELRSGKALTDYLWRGFVEPEPTFEEPEKK
jgi:hypothetical protein